MYARVQRHRRSKEAGGELFSVAPESGSLVIDVATGPHPSDCRGRYSFQPDVEAATAERLAQFARNRHVVGLWHTHPEPFPSPSGRDRETTAKYYAGLADERDRYLMVILGDRGDPPVMTVWVLDAVSWNQWSEVP
ncbi:Mov34/MPN/PAD-1 family protein [Burkholderia cepacia]|uniref:Mov34/MPN/PAD-1 family protein n=1 Tax=Burkholderia cepacia TaxID=292 RepID=UPI0026501DE4|nr:Mov34/MPN/PAD-1 family protein [Burkholderia cepacia]MDN7894378.1 Mov34/MPN/PAD-1 family protein [Burkholderia cepacia]